MTYVVLTGKIPKMPPPPPPPHSKNTKITMLIKTQRKDKK